MRSYFNLKRFRTWFKSKPLGRRSVDTRYALAEACVIGLLSAIAAVLLKEGINWLGTYRVEAAKFFGAQFVLPIAGGTLGMLSGFLIEQLSPAAAGGGIPQVKAVLAGYPIPCSLRVALVKTLGTILALGGGLTLGRRAPTVHIGAALASQLASWVPTSPDHRRQMIAAGAAAGLAAGFNTPIAGVIFVIEELMRDASGLTLETAVLASFIGSVVSRVLGSSHLLIPATAFVHSQPSSFSVSEIPAYLLLGILAGILGAFFNRGLLFCQGIFRRFNLSLPWRIGLAGLISGMVIALLPPFFRDNAGLKEVLVAGELGWQTIAIAFVAHFFLTILAYASGAPGGLFAPSLVLGSALGYLLGLAKVSLLGVGSEYPYAMAGMAAFFTGVVRVPVTAIVLVFEMTTDFNIVLPLMIGAAVAYIVGETVFPRSIYEHLLEASGINLKEQSTGDRALTGLAAGDLMQAQVETLSGDLTLDDVLQVMSQSHHRGFPVVEQGKLVGIFTQTDLAQLANRSGRTPLRELMTPRPISVNPDAPLSDVLYLLNRYQLSRLPVTEGNKLVGIITRSDIIRAEANQLGGRSQLVSKPKPSYVAYQTRSPETGKGRLLLLLSNPKTAPALLEIAAAIARYQDWELECLQVIKVPKHSIPEQTPVNTLESRKLLHRAERLGRHWKIPVHTQVRVATDPEAAILQAIAERHINLMVMGWKGSTSTPGAIFGNLADTLIRQAPCELVLVKLGDRPGAYPSELAQSWLVPMAGGPNAQRAIQLLPALTALSQHRDSLKVFLCQVHLPSEAEPDFTLLEQTAQSLREKLAAPVLPIPICSSSVPEAAISLATAQQCDVVILGASREGLLKQAIYGNIPDAIARGLDCTAILVRGAIELKSA